MAEHMAERRIEVRVQVTGVRDVAAACRVGSAALEAGTRAAALEQRCAPAPGSAEPQKGLR